MNLVLLNLPLNSLEENATSDLQVPIYEPLPGNNAGGEFSGDAIRLIDSRSMFTEDCIAAGCPEGLW